MRRVLSSLVLLAAFVGCGGPPPPAGAYITVLGNAQDGGYPQAACRKDCCRRAWDDPEARRLVTSLAIIDPASGGRWLLDASPDLREQLHALDTMAPVPAGHGVSGILLTHAHIGHYTGLSYLGREAMGTWEVPVWAMPRMRSFLREDGPWSQLVRLKNIALRPLVAGEPARLGGGISVIPFRVPHRDELSETVGFRIQGPARSVLYLPDIDKWDRWDQDLVDLLAAVDVAYLDGTFFADGELEGRDMSDIPHPFIVETMDLLAALPEAERAKVRFIHLNHTNPVLDDDSPEARRVRDAGFGIAQQGETIPL